MSLGRMGDPVDAASAATALASNEGIVNGREFSVIIT
jgi:hypothetical protein